MAEQVYIRFYNIDRCGFFRRGSVNPDLSSVEDTFHQIIQWTDDLNLNETKTYDASEKILNTYCYSAKNSESTGDSLIALWVEFPNESGTITSVNPNSKVGEAAVATTDPPHNNIPGYCTYFWILKDEGLLATIRYRAMPTNIPEFRKFVLGFLSKYSSYVYEGPPNPDDDYNDEDVIRGYRNTAGVIQVGIKPFFITSPKRKTGQIHAIREKRQQISRIIRKSSISLPGSRRPFMDFLRRHLRLSLQDGQEDIRRVRYEIDFTPSESDLEGMFETTAQDDSSWDDIGFRITGENKIIWLSQTLSGVSMELQINASPEGILVPEDLLQCLGEKKEEIKGAVGATE